MHMAWPMTVLAMICVCTAASTQQPEPLREGPVRAKVVERGAWLAEAFDGDKPDDKIWRVWHSDPERVSFRVADGRFALTARGEISHNGLWQKAAAKYKDVVLVARMDVRSVGPDPHSLALHLCGGDGTRSPDHWTEIVMVDQGDKARFTYWSAAPSGVFKYDASKELVLPRRNGDGFLVKVELDAGTNMATTWVHDGARWRQVGPQVELLLRTIHCEAKYRGG